MPQQGQSSILEVWPDLIGIVVTKATATFKKGNKLDGQKARCLSYTRQDFSH